MFRKSRRKIIAVIMAVLAVLLVGTFCIIYGVSYANVYQTNQNMLEHHIELFSERTFSDSGELTGDGTDRITESDFENDTAFNLSTFYAVLLDQNSDVLEIENAGGVYPDEKLGNIALQVMKKSSNGTYGSLVYRYERNRDYIIVAFMDNTIIQQNMRTLVHYTLLFGTAALILIFFLARYAAKRIVQPLEESYQRQKQFISDAGHELKTPVSVVNANAEMLSREIGDNQWLSNIQYENTRMGALVTQLLELAKTENVMPEMTSLNISRIVMGETLPFETIIFEQGLTLQCSITENLSVKGNPSQLSQLTSILLDNAVRHSDPGGAVQVNLYKEKSHVLLSVVNKGKPIPAEQQRQLFERFYRGDRSRSGTDSHYGLGLAIAKAIVTAHKGTIHIRCYDGFVEFRVSIPCV